MKVSLLDSYSDKEFEYIVKNSKTYADCMKMLGYTSNSGSVVSAVRKRIKALNIDTSHFGVGENKTKRTKENVFTKNATCNNSTLRRFYLKENLDYKCAICDQEPFWKGKPLIMILDHINGIHTDNRLENLRWVCPNCNAQLETTNRNKTKPKKNPNINRCIECGKRIYKTSTKCNDCENKERKIKFKQRLKNIIDRDTLKRLIRTTSFNKIGKMYGVSDNTIREWCKKYGLPFKRPEIQKYTDKEWDAL